MTYDGGTFGAGTIYRVNVAGEMEALYAFDWAIEGGGPDAALTRDADGELYGVAGQFGPHGHGSVFRFSRQGTVTVLAVLNAKLGRAVPSPLLAASDGGLYLVTFSGGRRNQGAVVRVDKEGGDEIVHSFRPGRNGHPWAGGLVQAGDGALYGPTQFGDRKRGLYGTIFRINLPPPR